MYRKKVKVYNACFCYKCSIMNCIVLIVLNLAELYFKSWVWGSSPRKCLHISVRNPAILDTSNEFIGVHIEVHSGVTITGHTALTYA